MRLFFDVLHGIKRMDVPLIMVVELMVFLAYEGKLESNSDMEKELFTTAINQFKERSSMFPFLYKIIFMPPKQFVNIIHGSLE